MVVEAWVVGLEGLVTAFILLHDWVPLGRLSNPEGLLAVDSKTRLGLTTVLSAAPFAIGLWWSWREVGHWSHGVLVYLWVCYGICLAGALRAWWVPYLFGSDEGRRERYRQRFAGTLSFMPERHGIRPDALHVVFHGVLVGLVVLLGVVSF